MSDQIIRCPQCSCEIPLDEVLTHQIRQQLDQDLRQEYADKLAEEKRKLSELLSKQARERVELKLKALQEEVEDNKTKLQESQDRELKLLKQQREVEQKSKELDLELARRLEDERKKIIEEVQQANADQFELKLAEREKTIKDMGAQIELLKKKAEQGSQQQQGEVFELKLEDLLRGAFPLDLIDPVQKGKRGGDVAHQVRGYNGQACGTILWEAKRAKNWTESWVGKLKEDMADSSAGYGIIVTTVLPANYDRFGFYNGVWVTDIRSAVGLATALRAGLLEVESARQASIGKNEKMEMLYRYLQSPQFRQRIEAAVGMYFELKQNVESEKATMMRHWAKQEKTIERAIVGISGMYGDMQGILGMSMPELESEELKALEPGTAEDREE